MRDASKMWFYSLVPGMTLAVVTAQSDVSLIDKYFGWSSEKYSAIPLTRFLRILKLRLAAAHTSPQLVPQTLDWIQVWGHNGSIKEVVWKKKSLGQILPYVRAHCPGVCCCINGTKTGCTILFTYCKSIFIRVWEISRGNRRRKYFSPQTSRSLSGCYNKTGLK